jgi:hypothetical protein
MRDSEASEDYISVRWEMKVAQLEERIDLDSIRLPIFASYSQSPLSIGSNESIAVVTTVDLFLMERQKDKRPPSKSWAKIQQDFPYFDVVIHWKIATKGKLVLNRKSFKIRPKFGKTIQQPPGVTVP